MNRTFQLFVSVDDVNLLSENINNVKWNTGTQLDASEEVGRDANALPSKCVLMSHHPTAEQINSM